MNRQDVLDQALLTLDSYGFADLSMRRLAGSLGVQPGALYWHFANKQSLLLAVADVILADVVALPVQEQWEPVVRRWTSALRDALLAHRDGAELVSSVLALRPTGLDPTAPCVRALAAAGLPPDQARAAAATLLHFVIGHTVDVQTLAQAGALGVAPPGDEEALQTQARSDFDVGVDLVVAGLRARLA